MGLFKRKSKKSIYVVTERSEDAAPFIIPHISVKGSYEETQARVFISTLHGKEEKENNVSGFKTSNTPISIYSAFESSPTYQEDEPYKEFPKVPSNKPKAAPLINNTPTNEDIKKTIEESIINTSHEENESEVIEQEASSIKYDENETIDTKDYTLFDDLFNQKPTKEETEETIKTETVSEIAKPIEKPREVETIDEESITDSNGHTLEELAIIRSIHKPKCSYKDYKLPSLDILQDPTSDNSNDIEWVKNNIEKIDMNLKAFKIDGRVVSYTCGPTFTRYAISLAPGVSGAKIESLSLDLQRSLEAMTIRIENPIPGKPYVGVEVPNKKRKMVTLKELLDRDDFYNQAKPLTFPVGLDVEGNSKYVSIVDLPHALVAGASGSGKSVFLNSLVTSLLYKYSPEDLRFFFIDPKQVDLQAYAKIPHLLAPIVSEVQTGIESLKWLIEEMERRFSIFRLIGGIANLKTYKQYIKDHKEYPNIPYVVIIIDEASDFLLNGGNEAMTLLTKLIQKCRAAGMHIFISLQKPVAKVISTTIKSNATGRFALSVPNQMDSMVILDQGGAEKLLGNGDMIYSHAEGIGRYQSAYVSDLEVKAITEAVIKEAPQDFFFNPYEIEKKNKERPGSVRDEIFKDVARYVVSENKCSTNSIIHQFGIGFNRGLDIVNALESVGIVGPNTGTKAREVLVNSDELEEILLSI